MNRKYTVSDKVLAANRRNLQKANAVPKSIRFRATARRLASCHANLQKAQAAQRDPERPRCPAAQSLQASGRAAGRRGRMTHGFHVIDLRRTAPQAGERQEDLDRHRALFLETFGGSRNQSRLASALADIVWRRWRALAWEAESETKQFYGRLAQDVDPLPGSALRPIAYGRQAGISQAELQTSRALDCLVILTGLGDLSERLGQLTRRFERLARTWMGLHTDEPISFPLGSRSSLSPVEWGYWKQSPEALSTPFLSSGQVAKRLDQFQKPPRALDPPEHWRPWGTARRPTRRLKALGRKAKDSGPQDGATIENRQSAIENQVDLPADFEAHRERLKAAFGSAAGAELSSSSVAFLERAAQLSWQRLRLIDEHLEKERAAVASLFAAGLEPGELAGRLVVLLAGDTASCGPKPSGDGTSCGLEPSGVRPGAGALMQQAHALERQLQQALLGWLKQQVAPPFRAACCEPSRPETKQPTIASIVAEIKRTNQRQEQSALQFVTDRELKQFRQKLDREYGSERSYNPPGEGEMGTGRKGWLRGRGFSDFEL
jgi:hypothetical protein